MSSATPNVTPGPETEPKPHDDLYLDGEHSPVDFAAETVRARALATRYELEFVDLTQFRINNDLFRSIPADLMLRYGFVPYRRDGQTLLIVVSDPSDLQAIDEIGLVLGTPGGYLYFELSAIVLGVIGAALVLVARVVDQARALQAELDEII